MLRDFFLQQPYNEPKYKLSLQFYNPVNFSYKKSNRFLTTSQKSQNKTKRKKLYLESQNNNDWYPHRSFDLRVEAMVVREVYSEKAEGIETALLALETAAGEIMDNPLLCDLLATILLIGNFVNEVSQLVEYVLNVC